MDRTDRMDEFSDKEQHRKQIDRLRRAPVSNNNAQISRIQYECGDCGTKFAVWERYDDGKRCPGCHTEKGEVGKGE